MAALVPLNLDYVSMGCTSPNHIICHSKTMSKGLFVVPEILNEPVLSYAPGSAERKALQNAYDELFASPIDAPMFIGGKEVRTGKTKPLVCPHDHQHNLGSYHVGTAEHVTQAIDAALAAKKNWEAISWESRAAVFLKVRRQISVAGIGLIFALGRRSACRPLPLEVERGHNDWAVQECLPGRNRLVVRAD
jgi:hypothetical protein